MAVVVLTGEEKNMTKEANMTKNELKLNTDKVTYRDFQDEDIHDVSLLLANIWHEPKNDSEALLVGKIDLAHFAIRTTYMRVAVLDGRVVGLAGVRVMQPSKDIQNKWEQVSQAALKELQKTNQEEAEGLVRYQSFENNAISQMLENSSTNANYELTIFAVSSEARGYGVGSTLLSQVMDHLKSQGAPSYYLFTDTGCTWQYYERRGMTRTASYKLTEREQKDFEVEEFFIYESEL